jgi:hypothetical protein
MSTETKSSPPRGAAAILALAAGPEAGRGNETQPGAGNRRPLIVRTWHFRPGRGSVCPDKETP